jgi:polyisoprenoid-binding protein YceI
MRKTLSGTIAVLALGLAVGATAQEAGSTLVIDGTSTLRSWSCEAASFTVEPKPTTGFEDGVLRAEPALQTVTLKFPVAAIECGNGKMNDHMRKALEAEEHPEIQYRLSTYDIASADSGVEVNADGELTIAGTARPINMAVTVIRAEDGTLRVQGSQIVKMTEFGVKPPSLMLGTLKVGDEVTVKFDVPLVAQPMAVGAVADQPENN